MLLTKQAEDMMVQHERLYMAGDDTSKSPFTPTTDEVEDDAGIAEDTGEFEDSDEFGFVDEGTNEYNVGEAFSKAAARTEFGLDSAQAIEETRELEVPRSLRPRRRPREIPQEVREQWENHGRVAGRLRRWFYSDPVVAWYYTLPRATRKVFNWAGWILVSAATIVIVFSTSAFGVYPIIADYLRPSLAPRPESPVRTLPREHQAFDFVEERQLSAREFRLATDCLWVVANPATGYTIDEAGLALELDGKKVAELDIRYNWDGLLRLYFGAGEVPPRQDLMLRIPVHRGGLWSLERGRGYELFRQGGREPPSVVIGPIRFTE